MKTIKTIKTIETMKTKSLKNKLLFYTLMALLLGIQLLISTPSSYANPISPAKGAELALHRLERLVYLQQIDKDFQSSFKSLTVELLGQRNPGEAYYKITLNQYPASDGSIRKLIILLDEKGKSLSHKVEGNLNGINAPSWPGRHPITLSEHALHFILEESMSGNTKISPYNEGLQRLEILPFTAGDNSLKAAIKVKSKLAHQFLEVILNQNATFNSYRLIH
ncbi:MAG: hypothetical protein HQK51_03980 [Oligoflexia bacterium]|nr:hypothetical protein [Oligoflexia bacterium]